MRYLIKTTDGYIYPYTDIQAKKSDMREPTTKELDAFFNVVATQEKEKTKELPEITDEQAKEWAKDKGLDNDKDAITAYGEQEFDTKINKTMTPFNMVRKLMALEDEQG